MTEIEQTAPVEVTGKPGIEQTLSVTTESPTVTQSESLDWKTILLFVAALGAVFVAVQAAIKKKG
jgi:hypothetical protein